jgi:anaerobic magnesium-protoporphyrin IX monomethyl ester cyclase
MKRIRVSLITPPYHSGVVESAGTWLNLGFVYIAGALREAGYEVDYYDAMAHWHDWEQIEKRIRDFGPNIVCTTSFTAAIPDSLKLLTLAKDINPDVVNVMGNVHATFMYNEILSMVDCPVDYIVRGEGEETLPKLLDCLQAGDDPAKVPGLAFNRDGGVVATAPAQQIADLDSLTPAWDLVNWPIYKYFPKKDSVLAIVSSSRGCTQNCSFCSQKLFWNRSWRARSAENFVVELEMLRDRFGVNVVMLADEIPTYDRQRWEKILDLLIEREVGTELLMETRVDDIIRDADIMDKYRLALVDHIYVGVEAGSQALLELFNKGTRVEQSKKAIDLINGADIVSETSFVLGMPDDTPESIASIVELAKLYNPDMAFFLAISPWPYADLYDSLKEYIAVDDYRKYNLVEPVIKPKNMTIDELNRELGKAAKEFYMNRFRTLEQLSPWKQKFMLEVFRILVENSYLAAQMKDIGHGESMPEDMKNMMKMIAGNKNTEGRSFAPIP